MSTIIVTIRVCSFLFMIASIQSLSSPPCPILTTSDTLPHDYYAQFTLTPSTNKVLLKHQIGLLFNIRNPWKCGIKCLLNHQCRSFNYGNAPGNCQLNYADSDTYPCHLVNSTEFDYYTIGYSKGSQWKPSFSTPAEVSTECTELTPEVTAMITTMRTQRIEYGPYSCTLPVIGCVTWWNEPKTTHKKTSTFKVEEPGDVTWTVSDIDNANAEDIINNNLPCPNILEVEPAQGPFIRYRMYIHYHADTGLYGYCMRQYNETNHITFTKCSGKTENKKLPVMEFTFQGNTARWTVPQETVQSVAIEATHPFNGISRYITIKHEDNSNKAWHVCRVP